MIWLIISIWVEIAVLVGVLLAMAGMRSTMDRHAERVRTLLTRTMMEQMQRGPCVFVEEKSQDA